jgi:hypothetical protein
MRLIDRFTRDEASAKIWWPLALILVVLFVLTFPGHNRAAQQQRADAAAWTTDVAAPAADAAYRADPRITATALADTAAGAPASLRAVRVWAGTGGTLLASSDPDDDLNNAAALNDDQLAEAVGQAGVPVALLSHSTPSGDDTSATLFQVYVASRGGSSLVTQTEFVDSKLLADVNWTWLAYRILFGVGALFVLGLAILSMREPIAEMGAGVPFFPASLPRGKELIAADEERVLRQSGENARQRVEGMEMRLRELEAAKLGLEGQLQRALSELAIRPRRAGTGAPPASVRAIPGPQPGPEPQPPLAAASPPAAVPSPEAEAPPAAASVEPAKLKPKKPAKPAPSPTGEEPADRPEDVRPVPRLRAVPAPGPDVSKTESQPVPPDDVPAATEARSTPASAAPETAPEAPSANGEDPSVVLPDADPSRPLEPLLDLVVLPDTKTSSPDPSSDEEAAEVLARLVDPVTGHPSGELDPGAIRARLARTAALKKPGSRERREREQPPPDAP